MREAGRRAASRGLPAHPRPAAGRRYGVSRDVLRDYAAALAQPTLPVAAGDGSRVRATTRSSAPTARCRPAWKGMAEVAVALTAGDLRRVDGEIARVPRRRRRHLRAARASGRSRGGSTRCRWCIDAATWARARGRARPARRAAQRHPRRPVRRAAAARATASCPPPSCFGHAGFTRVGRPPGARSTRGRSCCPATDLGRDADGEWRVLADRAQAPSGHRLRDGEPPGHLAGAARAVPRGRTAPDGAVLLGAALAPCSSPPRATCADPRVVVLSPGTHSETAYDQAFVAIDARLPARAGQRPRGARRLGLDEAAGWPATGLRAGRRDPAPGRRRVERPARAARRLPARRRRPGRGGAPRPRARRQRARRRRAREPRRCCPSCRRSASALLGEQLRLPSVPTWWCGDPDGSARRARSLATDPTSLMVRTIDGRRGASRRSAPTSCARADPRRAAPLRRPGAAAAVAGARPGASGRRRRRDAAARRRCARSRCATARRTARSSAAWRHVDDATGDVRAQQGRLGAQGRRRRPRPGPRRRAAADRGPLDPAARAARARGHVLGRPLRRARRGPAAPGAHRARVRRGLPDSRPRPTGGASARAC